MPRTPEQNFMTKYLTDIKKNKYISQNRPQKYSKMNPSRPGDFLPPILYQEQLYKISWEILNDSQEIK